MREIPKWCIYPCTNWVGCTCFPAPACDYSNHSQCSSYPLGTICFNDTKYQYIQFCTAHRELAEKDALHYIDIEPGLEITERNY